MTSFTAPGLSVESATTVSDTLQERLSALNDLHLTLKHIHWNVVGANFIGVHEMIDPQVDLVRGYADTLAERIATLGSSPRGTAKAIEDSILASKRRAASARSRSIVHTGSHLTFFRKGSVH